VKATISVVVLIAVACLVSAAFGEGILTREGFINGAIESVSSGDGATLKYSKGEVSLSEIARIDFGNRRASTKTGFLLVMTNGDRITGDLVDGNEDGIILDTLAIGRRKISIDNLLALFNMSASPGTQFIEETAVLDNPADLVFMSGNQETSGTISKITASDVVISVSDLGDISLAHSKVVGVKLAPLSKPKPLEGVTAKVYLTDGSRITGKLKSLDKSELTVMWFKVPVKIDRDNIQSVYFSGGKFTFLSDLKPLSVNEIPFFDKFLYPCQRDCSLVEKKIISLRKGKYFKGVSVHSKTVLVYELGGEYEQFLSTIGIDDEAKGKGDVIFTVYGDGEELFQSGSITGRSDPKPIKLEVAGVKELKLEVDFGKDLDTMDRAVWADAVLVRK